MAMERLPDEIREFTDYLRGLLARLDRSGGWCAVFWQRDPDGMRACLDGRELPPWDVLEALLQDLAVAHGRPAAEAETRRARVLRAAALAAHDARPGARDAVGDRLDVMLREQKHAAERRAGLDRALASATTREQADALRVDLAWARDDHERATARCAELRARLAGLDGRAGDTAPARHPSGGPRRPHPREDTAPGGAPGVPSDGGAVPARGGVRDGAGPAGPGVGGSGAVAPGRRVASAFPDGAAEQPVTARAPRKRRRGGARFAGTADEEPPAPLVAPPADALPLPVPGPRRTPRGARFAGAAGGTEQRVGPRPEPPVDAAGRHEVGRVVEALARLRGEGRGGEAHALLIDAAHWPAARLPLLAAGLERAGLGADWATLLWEAASLPAGRLVAVADALTAAGRAADGERLLRQGVVRPADEIGRAVLALAAEERHRAVRALLDACVRARTPQEAARTAAVDPQRLVPLLLAAARGVSDERYRDVLHALRVAGFAA
ncbi:hypothetical protein [Streptomyces griseomycini]|uniref:UL36 very large tegument protein n=1 Tax=Streptomyces griseomycini TaxID=66895 RepID=A0A7W7PVS0_9ACTN|nr:hypothetical protein [Streptomyces griseomycini]MBB4902169.1 hypothetical protein [Streptomyces griseomycini]GGR37567.1 hypothetical protein GCM10015536_49280 [Streptomyces griseomycini]